MVRVAGMWRRLLAASVDGLLLAPVLVFLVWLAFKVTGVPLPSLSDVRFESLLEIFHEGGSLVYGLLGVGILILVLYGFLFVTTTGATPGLRLLRVRVINIFGESPEWWRVLLRCLGCLGSTLLLGLGLVWIGFDREKRGLHDWLAGTYVIRSTRDVEGPVSGPSKA